MGLFPLGRALSAAGAVAFLRCQLLVNQEVEGSHRVDRRRLVPLDVRNSVWRQNDVDDVIGGLPSPDRSESGVANNAFKRNRSCEIESANLT